MSENIAKNIRLSNMYTGPDLVDIILRDARMENFILYEAAKFVEVVRSSQ